MNENVILIRLEINQPKVKEDFKEVISSMEEFELQESGAPSACDVLILEIGEDPKKEFQVIQKIQESGLVPHQSRCNRIHSASPPAELQ